MRARAWIVAVAAAVAFGWLGRGAFSDEPAGGGMPTEAQMAEMEKMMEQLATPGENHRWLAKAVGSWNVSGHFTEMDGSKTPTCGRACIRMTLGGRYQEQFYTGTWSGKRFEGRGFTGYDNEKKVFNNWWFDTMSTTTVPGTGTLSEDGTTLNLAGEWEMMGQKMPFRYVLTWVNPRQMNFKMYMVMGGQEMEVGNLDYTRR
jgi:hypothetical protein